MSTGYFTVVFYSEDVTEQDLSGFKDRAVAMSWTNAIDERDELQKQVKRLQVKHEEETPLWGRAKKNPEHCQCESNNDAVDCGCGFGQCLKGNIF